MIHDIYLTFDNRREYERQEGRELTDEEIGLMVLNQTILTDTEFFNLMLWDLDGEYKQALTDHARELRKQTRKAAKSRKSHKRGSGYAKRHNG